MKIINKTDYTTNSLKKLFTACLREDEKIEGKLPWNVRNYLVVKVQYSRNGGQSGKATINGVNIWMYIRNPHSCWGPPQDYEMEGIAYIFIHELAHIRGYNHKEISDVPYYETAKRIIKNYSLELKQPKPQKPKTDLQIKRYNHVLNMVEEKEKKLKRIQLQLKKWRKKQKYYENVLLAAKKIK